MWVSFYCKKRAVEHDPASLPRERGWSHGLFSEDAAGGGTSRSSPEAAKWSCRLLWGRGQLRQHKIHDWSLSRLEQKGYRNMLKAIFPESYHLCCRVWVMQLAVICMMMWWRPAAPERGPFLTEVVMLHYMLNPLHETSREIWFSPSTAQAVSEYSAHSWASLYSLGTYIFQAHTSSFCECWGLVLTSENLPRTCLCNFTFLSMCSLIVFQRPKFMWLDL